MTFNKASLIVTIVCLSYSVCALLFLYVLKIIRHYKAKKEIKEIQKDIGYIEVKHREK